MDGTVIPQPYVSKLEALRALMKINGIDGWVVTTHDMYQGEYVPESEKRLEWLCGFSGSAGTAIITQNDAAFFTDGRYVLQASQEIDTALYKIYVISDMKPYDYAKKYFQASQKIGFDPKLFTPYQMDAYQKEGCICVFIEENLVDQLWENQPKIPVSEIVIHSLDYAGLASLEKREKLHVTLEENTILFITDPHNVAWLLNIRGNDVPHTPIIRAFALFHQRDSCCEIFTAERDITQAIKTHVGKDTTFHTTEALSFSLKKYSLLYKIHYDPMSIPYIYKMLIDEHSSFAPLPRVDPCMLQKACKNETEQAGARKAHFLDGLAMTRFLYWLDHSWQKETITELSASRKLESFRAKTPLYFGPSFTSISGFKAHGAIIHYRVTPETDQILEGNGLYLLDSGGQYKEGTTDITRTILLGSATEEEKNFYTYVLKGHMALAQMHFPEGTTGPKLDSIARQFLWEQGADYAHGTGHGVGSYLSVHEGPMSISSSMNNIALKKGMILSNEPGYYKEGHYGIRIENLILVKKSNHPGFLCFETLTNVMYERNLIQKSLLTGKEIAWIDNYHKQIYENFYPYLTEEEIVWIKEKTKKL